MISTSMNPTSPLRFAPPKYSKSSIDWYWRMETQYAKASFQVTATTTT